MAKTLLATAHRNGAPQNLMPTVSIIVPVYNVGEALLRPCIESALAQTFRDFELILVDDASTDNSADVCASYSDPRIRLLRLPENGGLANARNQGIAVSTGNYITFLDADDKLTPRALQDMLWAATYRDADIVIGATQPVANEFIGKDELSVIPPKKAIEMALYQTVINHSAWGKLYRRQLCEQFPFRSGWYEDLRSFYQLFLAAKKVVYLPEQVYVYTDNPASYLHTFNLGRTVVLDVTEELVEYMETNHPELAPAAHDRALSAAFNIFNLLIVHKVDAPDITARCKATIRRYRRESLFNPKVRMKNKAGILLTYLGGFPALKLAAKIFQKP